MIIVEEPTIVDSHVTVVRSNAKLSWNYLGLALMRLQPAIEGLGEGTTGQTELSRKKLASIRNVHPPKVLIAPFDEIVVPLRLRIVENQQQAQTLAALRDTLLPRLISGKLRLPEAENSIAEATA